MQIDYIGFGLILEKCQRHYVEYLTEDGRRRRRRPPQEGMIQLGVVLRESLLGRAVLG